MEGSVAIIIITAVFLSISLIAVYLRCFVRLKIVKSFGLDDALMVVATVSRHRNLSFSALPRTNLSSDFQHRICYMRNRGRRIWDGKVANLFS